MFGKLTPISVSIFSALVLLTGLFLSSGCDNGTSLPTAGDVVLTADEDVSAAPSALTNVGTTVTYTIETCSAVLEGPRRPVQTMLNHYGVTPGGDPLTSGTMLVDRSVGSVEIDLTGTHELNLYEVYWIALGAASLSSNAIYMGNFVTDVNGDAYGELLRPITGPADITGASPTNYITEKTSHGYRQLTPGWYLFYSRGPYATDTNGNGIIDPGEYNVDGSGTVFGNPTLGSLTDGVQYVSTR